MVILFDIIKISLLCLTHLLKLTTALANGKVLLLANREDVTNNVGLKACVSILNDEGCPDLPALAPSET
jgi:hypothetical protein